MLANNYEYPQSRSTRTEQGSTVAAVLLTLRQNPAVACSCRDPISGLVDGAYLSLFANNKRFCTLIVFMKPACYRVSSSSLRMRCVIDCADNEQVTARALILSRWRSCTCPLTSSLSLSLSLTRSLALFGIAARCAAQCQRDLVKKNEILGPLSKVPLRRRSFMNSRPKFRHWYGQSKKLWDKSPCSAITISSSRFFELAAVFRNEGNLIAGEASNCSAIPLLMTITSSRISLSEI